MPQDRMLHPRAGHSEKVSIATDFEYRVWTQYMLSADDFGLMPCEAICLQADNRALAKKPGRLVQKALERLITIGLVKAYQDPQGRRYVCDPVWQKYQHIEYPKQSINPPPPDEILVGCHPLTQELFAQCFGKKSARFRLKPVESSTKDSRDVSEDSTLRAPARAETAKANGIRQEADGNGSGGAAAIVPPRDSDPARRAGGQPPLNLGLRRFKVWRWMLDDCIAALGEHADAFDLDAFLQQLDAKETRVIPDVWPWLKTEMLAEARRRGLATVETSDRKPIFAQSTQEMADGVLKLLHRDTGLPR